MKSKIQKIVLYNKAFRTILPSIFSCRNYSYLNNWKLPQGYDTGITVYNSSINEKVSLVLSKKSTATWYMCGPTVYAESHIGHACCYVRFDIIRRIMERIFNINVLLQMGITDIDDKIIKKSLQDKVSSKMIAKKYEFEFFKDMASMRVQVPSIVSRVSENIPLIISFCEKLLDKNFAYVTEEGNVYFIVSKSSSANILNEMPDDGQAIIDPLKRDKRDFALWKCAKPDEPYWSSPWGNGRPGWHIECSAMSSATFGQQIDIHSGGYDLLFPHHTNEKSQSEAFYDCSQWVNYWLHSGLLQVGNDVKMSKSTKNTISIKEFLKDNYVNDFRILCLQSSHRKNITYCGDAIESAKGLHIKLHHFINDCESYIKENERIPYHYEKELMSKLDISKEKIVSFLKDDFNTSQTLICLCDLVDDVNLALQATSNSITDQGVTAIAACLNYVSHILEILGVHIISKKKLRREFIHFVDDIVEFRNTVRLFSLCQVDKAENSILNGISEAYKSIEESYSLILQVQGCPSNIENIKDHVDIFHKETLEFVTALPFCESSSFQDQNVLKTERRKRSNLLLLCDNLRSSFQKHGIAIKDKKEISILIPLMSLKNTCVDGS